MNVKWPSASARQMTSGVVWTRPRKRASSRVSRSSRFELVRAMAAWSARPAEQVQLVGLEHARLGARHGERAHDLAARGAQRGGGHAAQRQPLGDHVVGGSCGMRGSVR